jgi:hypothetical protein
VTCVVFSHTRIQDIQSCSAQLMVTRFQQGLQHLPSSAQLGPGFQLGVLCHNQLVATIMVAEHFNNISVHRSFRDSAKRHQPTPAGRQVDAWLSPRLASRCAPPRPLSDNEPQFRTGPDQTLAALPDPHWLLYSCCLTPRLSFDSWKPCLGLPPCDFYQCLCHLYVQS